MADSNDATPAPESPETPSRRRAYVFGSSANAIMLNNLPDTAADVDFRKNETLTTDSKGEDRVPRAHYEEATLIQKKGVVNSTACTKCASGRGIFVSCKSVGTIHRGACGCCVWQSKSIDCSLATDTIFAQVAALAANREAKGKLARTRNQTTRSRKGPRGGGGKKGGRGGASGSGARGGRVGRASA